METNKRIYDLTLEFQLNLAAASAYLSSNVDIGCLTKGDHELKMSHIPGNPETLRFDFVDNSWPLHRSEITLGKNPGEMEIKDMTNNDKYKSIQFPFPYTETLTPKRLVATIQTLFKVLEYTEIPATSDKKPDLERIKNIIYQAIEELGLKLKPRGL